MDHGTLNHPDWIECVLVVKTSSLIPARRNTRTKEKRVQLGCRRADGGDAGDDAGDAQPANLGNSPRWCFGGRAGKNFPRWTLDSGLWTLAGWMSMGLTWPGDEAVKLGNRLSCV